MALAVCLLGSSAFAQPPVPTSPAPAPDGAQAPSVQPDSTVTVVGKTSGYRSSIDARSYSLSNDLQKATGSLSDVLRNVPSVQVDIDGNVSLRGDPNVTILVDGKPSPLFSGPGRVQALQSMSAGQFERVEVMTNPSAAQRSEGSGGIINLISKAPPKGGAAPISTLTVKANLGSGDRYDFGVSGSYSWQGLSLNGGADLRRGGFTRTINTNYELTDPTSGAIVPADQTQDEKEHDDTLTLYGTAGYDLDPHDHLDASINAIGVRSSSALNTTYQTSALTGPLALSYINPGSERTGFTSVAESLGLTHTLPGDGQTISVKLSVNQDRFTDLNAANYTYEIPVQAGLYQNMKEIAAFPELDLKVDYNTLLPNKAKLSLGYEGTFDDQSEDNHGVQGASPTQVMINPAFAQTFTFNQQVNAIYATYDQVFGKLTVQPGLRLEYTSLETDLVSSAQKGEQNYLEVSPSLHLNYQLDDTSQFKASYGRRTQRPEEQQLDPFRIETSTTLYSAGNPDLRPAITQSYELGYEYRQHTTDLQATLFYRDKTDLLTTVTEDIGNDVLLSTWGNLGHEHNVGLELVANRDILRNLTVNASTDLVHSETDASNLGLDMDRSAFTVSARVTLNWQVTQKDFAQIGIDGSGRQLTAQGYRGGAIFTNLGWKHQYDSRLATLLTANDPFGLSRRTIDIDTPGLVEVAKRKYNEIGIFIGLTYAFGSAPKGADNFNFGAQGKSGS